MKPHTKIARLLAALLAVYAAAGMCRMAAALSAEGKRAAELSQVCQDNAGEIAALKQALGRSASPEAVRQQAWRQLGMVSPGDVVFFDGG